jgi:hypothetical protein
MRKVRFNRFIQPVFIEKGNGRELQAGTAMWQTDYPNEGEFHIWGVKGDGEGGTNTMAIIELPDGKVEEVYTHQLKFV